MEQKDNTNSEAEEFIQEMIDIKNTLVKGWEHVNTLSNSNIQTLDAGIFTISAVAVGFLQFQKIDGSADEICKILLLCAITLSFFSFFIAYKSGKRSMELYMKAISAINNKVIWKKDKITKVNLRLRKEVNGYLSALQDEETKNMATITIWCTFGAAILILISLIIISFLL